MTENDISHAIEFRRVPKTRLDSLWNKLFGYLLFGIPFLLSIFSLLKNPATTNALFVSITLMLIVLLFYFNYRDRKLHTLQNHRTKKQNSELIEKALLSLSWKFEKEGSMYFCEVPLIFGKAGFHLLIFPLDNEILYNLRNIGSDKGRLPFLYGLVTLKSKKLEAALK